MQLALKKLFIEEAAQQTFAYALDLMSTEWDGVKPFRSPVQVSGLLQHNAEGVLLTAEAEVALCIPCDRCAEPVESRKQYHIEHQLVQELQHEEEEDHYILVEQDTLDLDELIRTDILLELPTKNLCKPDCKGLCPKCGGNRNLQSCDCEKPQIDPRLEKLRQLLD